VLFLDVAKSYADLVTTVFSTPIAAKAWFASAAAVLAVVQVSTAARLWGHLQAAIPLSTPSVQRIHRWSGRLALLCTVPVIFHCVFILGFQTTSLRVAIHSIVGSTLYGAFAAKILILKSHRYPGWVLPTAGGLVAGLLATLWLTSSFWYFTNVQFGF
jgi:Family of unknown function (DUF6529)